MEGVSLPSGEGSYLGLNPGCSGRGRTGAAEVGVNISADHSTSPDQTSWSERSPAGEPGWLGLLLSVPLLSDSHPGLSCPLEDSWQSRAPRGLRSSPCPASSPQRLKAPSPQGSQGPVATTQGFPAHRPCCGFYPRPLVDQQGPRDRAQPGTWARSPGNALDRVRVSGRCSPRGPCGKGWGQRWVGEDHGRPDSHPRTLHLPRVLGGSPWAVRAELPP